MKTIKIFGVTIKYNNKKVTIVDSYKVKTRKQMERILTDFVIETRYYSQRGITEWIKEWKSHNRLYRLGLFRSHTKDCDLEENEKRSRLMIYEVLGGF